MPRPLIKIQTDTSGTWSLAGISLTSSLLYLPKSSVSSHTQLKMSCCLPPDKGGHVRAVQTSNQCLIPGISSHTGACRAQLGVRTAWSPGGKGMLTPAPFTNLGAKWGTWLMVCVLVLSRAPPSPAMALGSRHIHGMGTSWETSLRQTLKEQKPGTLQPVPSPAGEHRGLFLFDYRPRVPRQTQATEPCGQVHRAGEEAFG